jgi:predicted nucleic acid-binding protein
MSLVLDLPAELENELSAEAAQLGLPLTEYVMRVLSGVRTARSGAELVAYWQSAGLIGSRPDITDAAEHARALREKAQSRARA